MATLLVTANIKSAFAIPGCSLLTYPRPINAAAGIHSPIVLQIFLDACTVKIFRLIRRSEI